MAEKKKRENIYKIAREAEVSIATVSRVLNNKECVSDKNREKVMEIIEEHQYIPDPMARGLAGTKTHSLGLFIPSHERPYLSLFLIEFISGAVSAAGAKNKNILLNTQTTMEEEDIHRGSFLQNIDGILLTDIPFKKKMIKIIEQEDKPCLLVNNRSEEMEAVGSVVVDNYTGGKEAIQHLVDLGHERIGIINGALDTYAGSERKKGVEVGLKENDLPLEKPLNKDAEFDQEKAYKITRDFLKLKNPPTAIFAASDWMCLGVLNGLREENVKVPEEISVVGFDDAIFSPHLQPPLTTVRQPLRQIGEVAARALSAIIDGEKEYVEETLPTELVARQSTSEVPGT